MALPRSQNVKQGQEGIYHCFTRYVRRAFLCGFDPQTGRDFSHCKSWLVDRLRFLIFLEKRPQAAQIAQLPTPAFLDLMRQSLGE